MSAEFFFDKYYEQDGLWRTSTSEADEERIRETITLIPSSVQSILEVGCGDGIFLNRLPKDIMVVGLERARFPLRYVQTEKVLGSAGNLPFRNLSSDLVACLELLEHLPYEIYFSSVKEIQRVARNWILVSVPNNQNLSHFWVSCPHCFCRFTPNNHVRSFGVERLQSLFENFELKISYLPNGVTLVNARGVIRKSTILNNWGLRENGYIMTVGRITPEKNLETLIKAFNMVNLAEIKLVVVGGAELQENYFESLKQISNNEVIFTGQLNKNQLSVLYAYCCLFVLPSLYEGLPSVLLEAMSFNCNILVSDIDAHIAVGLEQDDYFKAQDLEDLAKRIQNKISRDIKKDYSEFLLKNYNWDIIVEEVSKIYEKFKTGNM